MEKKVNFADALRAAERGGVTVSTDEYNGFADIGTGGILKDACQKTADLRLSGDACGNLDGYDVCDPMDLLREESLSSACLIRSDDGGVRVVLGNTKESTEL
jgi:hypothetical protein